MELKKIELSPDPAKPESAKLETPVISNNPIPMEKLSPNLLKIVSLVIALALGFGAGFVVKGLTGGKVGRPEGAIVARNVPEAGLKEGDIIGEQNAKEFKDSTTGVLQKGGLDGEGSHTLLRPGGVSKNVYLTSSVIDLDEFEGHQITVWGETFKGQKAGWLMDVGRVRVEKLNAPNPE